MARTDLAVCYVCCNHEQLAMITGSLQTVLTVGLV